MAEYMRLVRLMSGYMQLEGWKKIGGKTVKFERQLRQPMAEYMRLSLGSCLLHAAQLVKE